MKNQSQHGIGFLKQNIEKNKKLIQSMEIAAPSGT